MLIAYLVSDLAYFYQVCRVCVDHDRVCVSVNHIKTQLTEFKKKVNIKFSPLLSVCDTLNVRSYLQ